MYDRREHLRNLCSEIIHVSWTEPVKGGYRSYALLETISPTGASLQLDTPIAPGTKVRIQMCGCEFGGVVTYCTRTSAEALVGVHFDAGQIWSEQMYRPEHLFDPAAQSGSIS